MLLKNTQSTTFDNISSPGWLERRTFSFTVILETKARKNIKPRRKYRNPIHLAKEYKRLIDSGVARNESDLARKSAPQG
jgi:hypothetical protein